MAYELHSHTHYSDGRYAPAELIAEAARRGITVLAITDHDSARGAREARPLAAAAGIELIPAMEITTSWPGASIPPEQGDVDVLGYFIEIDSPEMQAYERALINDLHDRVEDCCRRLSAAGYPVTMDEVLAENPRYGGLVQVYYALIHKGLADDWKAAADIAKDPWAAGRRTPFTIRAAIERILLAGGCAVLAHPSIVQPQGEMISAGWLAQLVDWDLGGVEIYHHRMDEPTRAHFLALARQFDLAVTGGSDMHGWFRPFDGLGEQPVTTEMVDELRSRCG
jgi:3',5'-nucleoside bisphosphate phosphatase